MSWIVQAPVARAESFPGRNVLLSVEASDIAASTRPGQFVMAALQQHSSIPSPLLKRALAVYAIETEEGAPSRINLLLKVIGEGTRQLAQARPGDHLALLGPLGNGFQWEASGGKSHLIVAGGIGIASVLLLAQQLRNEGQDVHLIYGARSGRDLVGLEDFQKLDMDVITTTEDGSQGMHGLVTDGLQQLWSRIDPGTTTLYVCGPNPMMQAVSRLAAERSVSCQISVEVKMACGFGVCLGCSVKTRDSYRLACTHGPVFDAGRFVWEESQASFETVRAP